MTDCGRFHLTLAALLLACATPSLAQETRQLHKLDIAVAVFDPGVAPQASPGADNGALFPRIREVEARFLPFELRQTLVSTNEWGAVRLVPDADFRSELMVNATIVQSDGVTLTLATRVTDSTGRVWLDDTYTVSAPDSMQPASGEGGAGHYQALFANVSADLLAARARLSDKELASIVQVSLLRYANNLSSDLFAGYLAGDADGRVSARRLPANGDPMFERVERIRQFEYKFTDTVDDQYTDAFREIARAYNMWRAYRRQIAEYQQTEQQRLLGGKSDTRRGSYQAMKTSYDNFRSARMTEQSLATWAERFNNEVAPTLMNLDNRIVELTGGLDARYAEWRRILQALFEIEIGATALPR